MEMPDFHLTGAMSLTPVGLSGASLGVSGGRLGPGARGRGGGLAYKANAPIPSLLGLLCPRWLAHRGTDVDVLAIALLAWLLHALLPH